MPSKGVTHVPSPGVTHVVAPSNKPPVAPIKTNGANYPAAAQDTAGWLLRGRALQHDWKQVADIHAKIEQRISAHVDRIAPQCPSVPKGSIRAIEVDNLCRGYCLCKALRVLNSK